MTIQAFIAFAVIAIAASALLLDAVRAARETEDGWKRVVARVLFLLLALAALTVVNTLLNSRWVPGKSLFLIGPS